MKIPRYIKEAIIKARKHYALANKNNTFICKGKKYEVRIEEANNND